MRYLMGVLSILVFMLLAPPSAVAQESSLAGLAKKTKKERDEKQADPKVIRSDDLRHTRSRVYVPPGSARPASATAAEQDGDEGSAGGEGAEGEDAEQTPAEERAALAKQYQEDLALQQDRVSKLQEQIADAEAQLADQTTYYPGNPRRASLMELIEKCNVEIADAQRTITEIQRAARAQGISLR